MEELISIVVPVYNNVETIRECINSLINQSYRNLEIILINDGSTDKSLNVLNEFENIDKRINVISRENKGSINTRIEGAEIAKGKYVMFIDSDDWINEDTIEYTYNKAKKYNADIVKFKMIKEFTKENRKRYIQTTYKEEKYIEEKDFKEMFYPIILKTYECNSMCAMLIKREKLKNIRPIKDKIALGDDILCNFNLYSNIDNILFINKNLYHYRYTDNSITTTQNKNKIIKNIDDTYFVYSQLFKYLKKWNIYNKKNIDIVEKRIVKEVIKILIPIVQNNYSEEEIYNFINYARNVIDEELVKEIELESIVEKLFLKRKYKLFTIIFIIKYRYNYKIKNIIKNVLIKLRK